MLMDKENQLKKLLMALLLLLIGSFFFRPQTIQAAGLPFQVMPVLPSNQREPDEAYFDIIAPANSQTKLQLKVKNITTQPVKIRVKFVTLQTNNNGQLDYNMKQTRDHTLTYDANQLISGDQQLTLPANSTTIYEAQLRMPASNYDGIIAGGLVLEPITAAAKVKKGQIGITNRFSYAVPVIARNEDKTWLPKLQLASSKLVQIDYHNQLKTRLNNPSVTFVNQLRVEQVVTNLNTKKVYRKSTSKMQMAPNSHFDYRLTLPEKIPTGTYQVVTTAYYVKAKRAGYLAGNQQRYQYRQKSVNQVVVTKQQSRKLNQQITQSKTGGYHWVIYAVVGAIIALLLIIIGLLIYIVHNRKQQTK